MKTQQIRRRSLIFFKRGHIIKVLLVCEILSKLVNLLFCKLEDLGVPNLHFHKTPDEIEMSLLEQFFLGVMFVPIIETFLFQFLPFTLLTKIPFLKKSHIIILSALLFAFWHIYSIHYIIYTFIAGAFYMFLYFMRVGKYSFLTIVALHALNNATSILLNCIFPNF